MILIEPLPDDSPVSEPERPSSEYRRVGCLVFCLAEMFLILFAAPGLWLLLELGFQLGASLATVVLAAAIISATITAVIVSRRRKQSDAFWREVEQVAERFRQASLRYGYVPRMQGGSQRHRVTISQIDAIWPVEDVVLGQELDIPRPSFVVRTAQHEHVLCGGEAFLPSLRDGYNAGVFHLRETVVLELSDDMRQLESATGMGRPVPVDQDWLPRDARPAFYTMFGFAILDDPDLIRRLPPFVVVDRRR